MYTMPPVRAAPGLPDLQYLALGVDCVALEDWPVVSDPLVLQIGDGLSGRVSHAHPDHEADHQGAHDQYPAMLMLLHIVLVDVQRIRVHREEGELMIVRLGDRLAWPVLETRPPT